MREVKGLRELSRALAALPGRLAAKAAPDAVAAAAGVLRDAAAADAPRGPTGKLHRAVVVTPVETDGLRVGCAVEVVPALLDAPGEAAAVEFGTSVMAANPFMRRAHDGNQPQMEAAAREALARGLSRELGG